MNQCEKQKTTSLCIIVPIIKKDWLNIQFFNLLKQLNYPVIIVCGEQIKFSEDIRLLWGKQWSLVSFGKWKGKGAAIEKGMVIAEAQGHQMALTLDCREKVSLDDLNKIIAKKNQRHVITMGIRGTEPFIGHSLKRRLLKLSNFLYWLETGRHCTDSRSSIRLYPTELMNKIKFRFHSRVWELEALVRAVWSGLEIKSIDLYGYDVHDEVSPIKKVSDYVNVMGIHGYLIVRRLVPWPFKQLVKKQSVNWPPTMKGRLLFIWKRFFWKTKETSGEIALSVAMGLFAGLLPNVGTQSFVALYFAQRLHLNKVLVLLSSLISITPLLPILLYLNLLIGHSIKTRVWQAPMELENITWQLIKTSMEEFVLGSIVLAIVGSIFLGLCVYFGLQLAKIIKYRFVMMRRRNRVKLNNDN